MGLTWSTYSAHGAHVLELAGQLTRMTVLLLEPQLAKLLTRIIERGYTRLRELQEGAPVDAEAYIDPPAPKARGRSKAK